MRKIRLDERIAWEHHRGGWSAAVDYIYRHCHIKDGTLFISAVEDVFQAGKILEEPWVGVVHQAPRTPTLTFPDLYRLLQLPAWKSSLKHCRGLWVLCKYVRDFLLAWNVPVPINVIPYPAELNVPHFDVARFHNSESHRLVSIGEYLRTYRDFFDLEASSYFKLLLLPTEVDSELASYLGSTNVDARLHVANDEYDQLLADSVVFLSLKDGVAITTIVECIARGTPVLVNRVPGVVEYLGDEYPFYYSSLTEAAAKLANKDLVCSTSRYLLETERRACITYEYFIDSIKKSSVYRALPIPQSAAAAFRRFDVTLSVCSYARLDDLKILLERLCTQDFSGTFEIIIWNNNLKASKCVDEIVSGFSKRLTIRLIHSSENYYCAIRFALPAIMRSDLLLICDDDSRPGVGYIKRFVDKYDFYGPDTVLCARGHVFLPHKLNEEHPETFWASETHKLFFDESTSDRRVHFMHADNCLIPKQVIRKACTYDLERFEFTLVDDYWLSFILGHYLNIPIWKIKADDVFSFAPSADDPAVALYHNPAVIEQRTGFYIYHMRDGWPVFGDLE